MKKIIYIFILLGMFSPVFCNGANASLVSDRGYRAEQKRYEKNEAKQIKELFKIHYEYANQHDAENLKSLYSDNFVDNDGFNKEVYFKNVVDTWDECSDVSYKAKIKSIKVEGDIALVLVEETATGTVYDNIDIGPATGEIHSKSEGIYHLEKINAKWFISGETVLSDESSLLYGDARFMNISMIAPAQVFSGEQYTATVKVDSDEKVYMIGSIEHDPIVYPAGKTNAPLRVVPPTNILERVLKANSDNLNEYAVASLAISKTKDEGLSNFKIYMVGLACVMKRINVVPKNNFIKFEGKNERTDR